jgi:Xaa-Pro aminopeptidase
MDHEARIAKVAGALEGQKIDALLVTDLTNVRYLTGFEGSNGIVLIAPGGATFFSDPRYEARAKDMVKGAAIEIYRDRLTDVIPPHLEATRRLGIEGDTMTVSTKAQLSDRLTQVELIATSGVVESLRRTKEPAEVELIKKACDIGDRAFSNALENLSVGRRERDIGLEIEVFMREAGAEGVSFEPIVGSGPLSAHIHHTPSDRRLEKGDLVLFDLGSRLEGYCSDLTRTVVLGPATDEQKETYEVVLRAQSEAIAAVRAGVAASDVDSAARSVIDGAGQGDAFPHGLGHGIGLDVHEQPRVSRNSTDKLHEGEVVTIEPGIYRAVVGGIRIEDCVWVGTDGCEVLGSAPKDRLIEL